MEHECIEENEYDHLGAVATHIKSRDTSFIGGRYSTPLSSPIAPTNAECHYENSGYHYPPPDDSLHTSIELSHASNDQHHYDVLGATTPGVMISHRSKEPLVPPAFDPSLMQYERMDDHHSRKENVNEVSDMKQRTDYVTWVFRFMIALLLVAVVGVGYFCYYFNKELAKYKELAHNEAMERLDGIHKVNDLLSGVQAKEKKNEKRFQLVNKTLSGVQKSIHIEEGQQLQLQMRHEADIRELKDKLSNVTSKKHQRIYGNILRFDPESISVKQKHFISGLVKVWFPSNYRYMQCHDNTFTNKDADVICKTIGYSRGGSRDKGQFDDVFPVYFGWTFPYACRGNETSMLECPPYRGVHSEKTLVVRVKCDYATIV